MRAFSRAMARKSTGKMVLDRIDRRLKALGMSDNRASELATGSRDTLRSLRRNIASGKQRGVSTETIQKFAPVLETSAEWLTTGTGVEVGNEADHIESSAILSDPAPDMDGVDVVGYVGAGAQTHRYAVGQGALARVARPAGATDQTVAVQIMGDSLGEMFDRWLVFYDDVKRPFTVDLLGKLCVVGLPDDRVLVKKIRRAKSGQPDRFDLLSSTEAPIENVQIVWAARVKQMVPQ